MPEQITITITVNGKNFNLSGIPERAFVKFQEQTKRHFPDAGDDAWASALTEVILSFTSYTAYFMTDIPEENSKALEEVMDRVGWTFEQFHAYLLHSALKPGALKIVSFQEKEKTKHQLGTLILTGLRKSTFDKLEELTKVPVEATVGIMFQGFENGEITLTPPTVFAEAVRSGRNTDITESGRSFTS